MTFWLVVIAIMLILIFGAMERGNSIKAAQIEAENERREIELDEAEDQREYDAFFAMNGYPHRNDVARVAAWGAKRGMSPQEAYSALLDRETDAFRCKAVCEGRQERLEKIRKHDWQAAYVTLAFTPEERSGQELRSLYGMIWKSEEEKYFLSLTDMSAFADGGCSLAFPLKEKTVPRDTFTIEKEQEAQWDEIKKDFRWVDVE